MTKAKRVTPRHTNRAIIGSARDIRVIREIGFLGMLTTGQVERLAFPSRRRAQRRLRAHLDCGLVRAHLQGGALHRDNVWTLTRQGLAFLEAHEADTSGLKVVRLNARSQKLRHTILIREAAVSLLVAEDRRKLAVLDVRLDAELAREDVLRAARVIPDGYALCEIGGIERAVLWEVATRSQPLVQLKSKLLAYARAVAADSVFFRSEELRLAFLIESKKRLEHIRAFAEELRIGPQLRLLCLEVGLDPEQFVDELWGGTVGFEGGK